MIKVLHLIDTDKACGPGRTVLETARSLQNTEFECTIAAYNYGKEKKNTYLDEVKSQGFDQVLIPIKNQYDPWVIIRLQKLIKDKKIDILHTHGYKSDLLGLLAGKLCGIKTVSTVHGWIQNNFRAKVYVYLNKRALIYFDRLISVSAQIRNDLVAAGVSSEKISVIHNALNLDYYAPGIKAGGLRDEFGLSYEDLLIATIGRLSPEKGQIDFLKSAKIILGKYPKSFFFIIGEGPDIQRLKYLAKLLDIDGRVKFTGHRKEILNIYRSLDYVVIPSYTEGLSNVALEAMAMGVPVIATRVGGTPEIIKHQRTGLLINTHNPEEVAEAVHYLIQNPSRRDKIAENAKKLIEEKFDFKKRMEKVKEIYRELR